MNMTGVSAAMNFAAHQLALDYAKKNLPEEEYNKIKKSYYAIIIWTVLYMVVCVLPIVFVSTGIAVGAPFSRQFEADTTPANATDYKLARVDYDDNFYWTHDSVKYEYALADYGFAPEDYEFGDKVKVYVDDAQNIIKIVEYKEGMSVRDMEIIIGASVAILVPVLLTLCVYVPIVYFTFGKPWREFNKKFNAGEV